MTRRIRGWTRWTDAFLPLAILNLGQHENLLWNFQMQLVLASVFSCGALLALYAACAERRGGGRLGGAAAVGIALLLLCALLSGASGLVLVAPMIAWLLALGWRRVRSGEGVERQDGRVMEIAAGLRRRRARVLRRLLASRRLNRSGGSAHRLPDGPRRAEHEPRSGAQDWYPFAAYILAALVVASGMLAFLIGAAMLIGAIAWGRSGSGLGAGFTSRYTTAVLPLLCRLYLVWELSPRPLPGRGVQLLLCLLVAAFVYSNARIAATDAFYGRFYGRDGMARFEQGVREGLGPEALASIEGRPLYIDRARLVERLEMLRRREMGPFKRCR